LPFSSSIHVFMVNSFRALLIPAPALRDRLRTRESQEWVENQGH
jgi:hypothetical protein